MIKQNPIAVTIVKLQPDDWKVLRSLKLHSLEEERIAFEDCRTAQRMWRKRTEPQWRAILEGKLSSGRAGENIFRFARVGENYYVGMVSAVLLKDKDPDTKDAIIQHMYVKSNYRRFGIGKLLLTTLLDELRLRNINTATLKVVATQQPAISMYRSLGFINVQYLASAAMRDGVMYDEITMRLHLP